MDTRFNKQGLRPPPLYTFACIRTTRYSTRNATFIIYVFFFRSRYLFLCPSKAPACIIILSLLSTLRIRAHVCVDIYICIYYLCRVYVPTARMGKDRFTRTPTVATTRYKRQVGSDRPTSSSSPPRLRRRNKKKLIIIKSAFSHVNVQ